MRLSYEFNLSFTQIILQTLLLSIFTLPLSAQCLQTDTIKISPSYIIPQCDSVSGLNYVYIINTSDTTLYLIPVPKDTTMWKKAFSHISFKIKANSTKKLHINSFNGRYSLNYTISLQPQGSTISLPPSVIVVQGPPPPPVKKQKSK